MLYLFPVLIPTRCSPCGLLYIISINLSTYQATASCTITEKNGSPGGFIKSPMREYCNWSFNSACFIRVACSMQLISSLNFWIFPARASFSRNVHSLFQPARIPHSHGDSNRIQVLQQSLRVFSGCTHRIPCLRQGDFPVCLDRSPDF
jgi:hypothetical protein